MTLSNTFGDNAGRRGNRYAAQPDGSVLTVRGGGMLSIAALTYNEILTYPGQPHRMGGLNA